MDPISEALNFAFKILFQSVKTTSKVGATAGAKVAEMAAEKKQAATERRLRQEKPLYALGEVIESQPCAECMTENEQGQVVCYVCGAALEMPTPVSNAEADIWSALGSIPPSLFPILGSLGAIIFLCIICQVFS